MIELIFVIVILGILAAVAIPKLAATRNDAKVASEVTSIGQSVQNFGAEYTAKGDFIDFLLADGNNAVACVTFSGATVGGDGNVTITNTVSNATKCPNAVRDAVWSRIANNGINSAATSGASKTYQFGGTGVVE